jgi:hypothetical protein
VGISGKKYSLSGAFNKYGKLLVILAFLLGKNRCSKTVCVFDAFISEIRIHICIMVRIIVSATLNIITIVTTVVLIIFT